jgi:hypothetical protein
MFHCTDDTPVCRGCGRTLKGSPYFRGGRAYIPETGAAARVNYFGGWVCSRTCDHRASLEQEQSMPGHGWQQKTLGSEASAALRRNWAEA